MEKRKGEEGRTGEMGKERREEGGRRGGGVKGEGRGREKKG